jgi:hypothetical protein
MGPLGRKRSVVCDPRTDKILQRATAFYQTYTGVKTSDSTVIRRALDLLLDHIDTIGPRLDGVERELWFRDEARKTEIVAIREAGDCRFSTERTPVVEAKPEPLPWMRRGKGQKVEPTPDAVATEDRPRPGDEMVQQAEDAALDRALFRS